MCLFYIHTKTHKKFEKKNTIKDEIQQCALISEKKRIKLEQKINSSKNPNSNF